MKNLLIVLTGILIVIACHKKDDPQPTTSTGSLDYADSVKGNYIGPEHYYSDTTSTTLVYSSTTKSFTITKIGANTIQVSSLYNNAKPIFTLKDTILGGTNYIYLALKKGQGMQLQSTYNITYNSYNTKNKGFVMNIKDSLGTYSDALGGFKQ